MTQPARKKETATQLALLEAALRYIRDNHSDTSIEAGTPHALLTS